eukprot:SAG31_NODE_629_length_13436_cov_116.287825_6_plen_38_part_00
MVVPKLPARYRTAVASVVLNFSTAVSISKFRYRIDLF